MSEVTRRGFLVAALPLWLGAAYRKVELAGVPIEVLKNGRSKRRYLLIHGNEQTAREVLQALAASAPATRAAQRLERQYALRSLMLGGPDGQVM